VWPHGASKLSETLKATNNLSYNAMKLIETLVETAPCTDDGTGQTVRKTNWSRVQVVITRALEQQDQATRLAIGATMWNCNIRQESEHVYFKASEVFNVVLN